MLCYLTDVGDDEELWDECRVNREAYLLLLPVSPSLAYGHHSQYTLSWPTVSAGPEILEKFNHGKILPGTCGHLLFVNIPDGKGGCGNH